MSDYEHSSIQKLNELYQKHKQEMGRGLGFTAMMWKAISPEVPLILKELDKDPEMLAKIKSFLETIVESLKEDTMKAVGKAKEIAKIGEGEEAPKEKTG